MENKIGLLLVLYFLSACSQMQMKLPKDLTDKTVEMPVTITKTWYLFDINKIVFGNYIASSFNMGWNKSSSMTVSHYAQNNFSKRYEFSLKQEKSTEWKCECGVKATEKDLKGKLLGGDLYIPIKNETSLDCTLKGSPSDSSWVLNLSKNIKESENFRGELSSGAEKVQVESSNELAGQSFSIGNEPTGYIFRKEGEIIAATETLNPGRVWIISDSTTNLQPQLAAAATALIVLQTVLGSIGEKK